MSSNKSWNELLVEALNYELPIRRTDPLIAFYIAEPSKEEVNELVGELEALEEMIKAKD